MPWRLGNRDCWLEPLRLKDLATAELCILAQRDDPVLAASEMGMLLPNVAGMNEIIAAAIEEYAADRSFRQATFSEVMSWLAGTEGLAFTAWRLLFFHGQPLFLDMAEAEHTLAGLSIADLAAFHKGVLHVGGLDHAAAADWKILKSSSVGPSKDRGIPWKRLLHKFAYDFGWTPEQVGNLTFWHVQLYLADTKDLDGLARMTAAEALAFERKRKLSESGRKEPKASLFPPRATMHPARRAAWKKAGLILPEDN